MVQMPLVRLNLAAGTTFTSFMLTPFTRGDIVSSLKHQQMSAAVVLCLSVTHVRLLKLFIMTYH